MSECNFRNEPQRLGPCEGAVEYCYEDPLGTQGSIYACQKHKAEAYSFVKKSFKMAKHDEAKGPGLPDRRLKSREA